MIFLKQEDADSLLHNTGQTFEILGLIVPEKSLTQISLHLTFEWQWENEKMEKEGKINHSILLFFIITEFNPL